MDTGALTAIVAKASVQLSTWLALQVMLLLRSLTAQCANTQHCASARAEELAATVRAGRCGSPRGQRGQPVRAPAGRFLTLRFLHHGCCCGAHILRLVCLVYGGVQAVQSARNYEGFPQPDELQKLVLAQTLTAFDNVLRRLRDKL